MVLLIVGIIGFIWRYGKRINENYHTLIAKLEGNDGVFAKQLADHEKLDVDNDTETKRRLTVQDGHIATIETGVKELVEQRNRTIKNAERAATQATIAASEATVAAKLAIETASRVDGKLESIITKIDRLPQVQA